MFIEAFYKVKKVIYLDEGCELVKVIDELKKAGGNISNADREIVMIEEIDEVGNVEFIDSENMCGQPTCILYSGDAEIWNNMKGFNNKKEEKENE